MGCLCSLRFLSMVSHFLNLVRERSMELRSGAVLGRGVAVFRGQSVVRPLLESSMAAAGSALVEIALDELGASRQPLIAPQPEADVPVDEGAVRSRRVRACVCWSVVAFLIVGLMCGAG